MYGANVYGGIWLIIEVSSQISTEISFFSRIGEAQVRDSLKNPSIELFRGKQFKI